MMDERFTVRA